MSPLIFNMALEHLAIFIRSHQAIEGAKVKDKIIKLSSIKHLFQTLAEFGRISGYKIGKNSIDGAQFI